MGEGQQAAYLTWPLGPLLPWPEGANSAVDSGAQRRHFRGFAKILGRKYSCQVKKRVRLLKECQSTLIPYVCQLSRFSHVRLCATLWTVTRQSPLSMGFPRQERWSGLPFPFPGDLRNPEIERVSLMSPSLAGGFFTTSASIVSPYYLPGIRGVEKYTVWILSSWR